MGSFALITATILLAALFLSTAVPDTRGEVIPPPKLSVVLYGETVGGRQVFSRTQLLIPEVPLQLTVTFHNNDTMDHTFTINDVNGTKLINTGLVAPGQNATLNFTVVTMARIVLSNGTSFVPEPSGSGIRFYCVPHGGAGMVGLISLASLPAAVPEKGILLRAYWIGIIGIAVTLVWVGIVYYVIKSSSRHFVDHSEHVRKGLP